ncbi:MAG: serine/threonine phosphatase [Leptolyngbyaceae cyanobacterium bins.349]|nr:serine/threonine phosphatase [Leptolyngbyaceae cyanobacterium bins.349]
MLICPQCQFDNPTTNNFCQQCGVSLTQNTCPECSSLVPFEQLKCQECGTVAGVLWWAIITAPMILEAVAEPPRSPLGLGGFLDLQQRYQMIEPFSAPNAAGERQGRVLDCQPFQLSVLESLVIKTLQEHEPTEIAGLTTQNCWTEAMEVLGIPAIAYPYISLSSQFYQALPTLHNAWKSDQATILLVEDRSEYPHLMDFWQDDQQALPVLQLLQWLYEMVELWQAMAPWNCQQSLLVLDNLRVDVEDQLLCLQRLHFNPADSTPTLQDLGRMWQMMVAESQKTYMEALSQLFVEMVEQPIMSPEAIQERIEAIAQTYQALSPPPSYFDKTEYAPQPGGSGWGDRMKPDDMVATQIEPHDEDDDTQLDNDEMPTIVLPMQLFHLEEVGRTDVGRQRDHNEDYFGIETQLVKLESPSGKTLHARNLYILCDGMGGHAGGEVASALAVDTIRNFFKERWHHSAMPGIDPQDLPDRNLMIEAVLLANKAIFDVNQQNARSGSGRMGTTLVMVLIYDTQVAVAHVGDSRLYRYTRKRGLEQITVDHEVGQREIQRGVDPETAYSRPDSYQLTQALGPRDEQFVKPDVQFFELTEDMLLLLCSDGLTDNDLLEKHWESHVQPLLSSQTNLDKGVNELVELANQYNGHDNITAIAIRAKVRPCLEHLR